MNSKKDYFMVYLDFFDIKEDIIDYGFDVIDYTLSLICKNYKNIRWVWNTKKFEENHLKWLVSVQEIMYKYFDSTSIKQVVNITEGIKVDNLKIINSKYNIDLNVVLDCVDNKVKDVDIHLIDIAKKNNGKVVINYDSNNADDSWIKTCVFLSENELSNVEFSYNALLNDKKLVITEEDYICLKQNYENVYNYWSENSKSTMTENSFSSLLDSLLKKNTNLCNGDCRGKVISVSLNGAVSPCYFIDNGVYTVNNIFDFHTINDIFETSQYKRYSFEVQKRMLTDCNMCNELFACNGGCNAIFFNRSGNISLCDKNYCKTFKAKLAAMYNVFRNIDIYSGNKVNSSFLENLVRKNILTVLEIKSFLREKGISVEWNYSEDNFLESKEFKLFRLFNLASDLYNLNCNSDTELKSVVGETTRKNRYEMLSKLYDNFYIDIISIINL